MAINLNDTVPAAPSGSTNVVWQEDVSGNVSAYVPATGGTGPIDSTGNVADVAPTTILTPESSGLYRITAYIIVTTPDGVSSTLPSVIITWTDADNSTGQTFTLTPTNTGNSLTSFQQANMEVSALASGNIQYATSGYASGTPATMTFALHIRTEPM